MAKNIIDTLNELAQLGLKNQLVNSGAFHITPSSASTEIDNALLKDVSLQFVSSSISDFDGGIEIIFTCIGELGMNLLSCINMSNFRFTIHNLNDEIECMEDYCISSQQTCDFIHASTHFLNTLNQQQLNDASLLLDSHLNSQKIQHLSTMVNLKMTSYM